MDYPVADTKNPFSHQKLRLAPGRRIGRFLNDPIEIARPQTAAGHRREDLNFTIPPMIFRYPLQIEPNHRIDGG